MGLVARSICLMLSAVSGGNIVRDYTGTTTYLQESQKNTDIGHKTHCCLYTDIIFDK